MSSRSRSKPSKPAGSSLTVSRTSHGKPSSSTPPTKPAHRRVLHQVNTTLTSYDRTDPFTALNTLLKLLSSLPTRIGGCHLKLTPDEHKLSLHLLGIVEPFVGLSSQDRRTLTRQPTELLDAIVFHVDSKRDLLSLALSCKRMHTIVFPRHFDYRVVKAKVSSLRLWNHLIVNRSLARNVRVLEILDERTSEREMLSTDDELGMHSKQERFLGAALGRMSTLREFRWRCNHSPMAVDDLWPSLVRCTGSLQEVDVCDNLMFNGRDNEDSDGADSDGPSNSTSSNPNNNLHPPNPRPLLPTPPASSLLLTGRWPHLTSLTLTSLHSPSSSSPTIAAFLSAHPQLQVLHIDLPGQGQGNGQVVTLEPGTLPRLRELKCGRDPLTPTSRPLETLKGPRLSTPTSTPFLTSLAQFGSSLRRLELLGWHDMEDLRRLWSVCRALCGWMLGSGSGGGRAVAIAHSHAIEWATLLSPLTELTTFHGVKLFYEVASDPTPSSGGVSLSASERSKLRKNEEIASVLAWKCPKLRREGGGKVLVLVRDGEKVRYESRRVKG
ncbi:hypothetical protein BC629DRAFT_1711724 [Irpex lacteus]|nr:hypothetical protein BC629DRAFT_1711724 [Irpex lacteus]